MHKLTRLSLPLVLLAVIACEPPAEPETTETAMSIDAESQPELARVAELAREDFAERAGVAPAAIEVVEAHAVTWADGALGCPEPGMMYTQALVEGFYVLLRTEDREQAYHAGSDAEPFACPAERSAGPPPEDARRN